MTRNPQTGDDPWKRILDRSGETDLFVDFCCQSYFLNDPAALLHCPDIYDRLGLNDTGYAGLDHFVLTVTTEPASSYPESYEQHQFGFHLGMPSKKPRKINQPR
jgi:hypothetical protein